MIKTESIFCAYFRGDTGKYFWESFNNKDKRNYE